MFYLDSEVCELLQELLLVIQAIVYASICNRTVSLLYEPKVQSQIN